jgi:hypothetical protein
MEQELDEADRMPRDLRAQELLQGCRASMLFLFHWTFILNPDEPEA